MTTKADRRSEHEPTSHVRPTGKRHVPFLASFMVAFLLVPALFAISRGVMLWDPATGVMVADAWLISGGLLALIAISVGLFHAKRNTLIIKHVATTIALLGLGGNLYTFLGWHHRFMNVAGVFGTAILWGSWMLYRIDVFRAKATGETTDSWGEVIGLAKSRPRKVKTTDSQVIIDVEHGPGETIKDVRRAAEELEDKTGAIVGRTTVTPNERGGGSTMALTMADPFDVWRPFPGLSHPGSGFAMPFRTAYYETGEDQWFGFVRGRPSPYTDFVAPSATFVGLVGATGVGKSGEENNIAGEGLARRNVIVCWVDAEKLYQNAGWALDMLGMAAKNREQAKRLSRALRKLAEYRVELFGQISLDAILDPDNPDAIGGREWTDELAEETGEGACLVIMDEADTFLSKGEWDWLGKRGRSLGIFLVPSVPRASTQEVPAAFRGSIASWKTFSIGDKYSGEFTLSQEARDGGANPESLRLVGAHYFDLAPGVPTRMWPVLCRSYWSDGGMLRRMVKAAREGKVLVPNGPVRTSDDGRKLPPPLVQVGTCRAFEPAVFTEEAIRWMGEDYDACTPAAVMALRGPEGHDAGDDEDDEDGGIAVPDDMEATQRVPAAGRAGEDDMDDDDRIERNAEGSDPDEGPNVGTVATLAHPEFADEARGLDPHEPGEPIVPPGEHFSLPDDKPEPPSEEQEVADIHAALVSILNDGLETFTPADVQARMKYAMRPYTMTRRLSAICDGDERLTPPGMRVERLRAGEYVPVRCGPRPHRAAPKREDD
jgi:hypothetical protein